MQNANAMRCNAKIRHPPVAFVWPKCADVKNASRMQRLLLPVCDSWLLAMARCSSRESAESNTNVSRNKCSLFSLLIHGAGQLLADLVAADHDRARRRDFQAPRRPATEETGHAFFAVDVP
jgi:hypothetical protein